MSKTNGSPISASQIQDLREQTGAGIMDCKKALEESGGNLEKARAWLRDRGVALAAKREGKEASKGLISSYIHLGGTVGVLLELNCETDFVAKTDEFKHLSRELAMQIAAMNPKGVAEFFKQEYIRDSSQTVDALIKSVIGKLGENIMVKRFARFEI